MMEMQKEKDNEKYDNRFSEISNVEQQHDILIPEEFPEGAFGSPIHKHTKVESKSTEWEKGQQRSSAFVFPDQEQHDDLPRRAPGSHPLHDE
ncbi:hypothetical protein SPD48_07250 [Pseudogracilibacillus sp. SE30717A]|uniref:hypothetical protein n=1 Tax=Pseudogracilibacillus sp. SE30717A TaxID=3098293 RepID=UPI00300E1D4D